MKKQFRKERKTDLEALVGFEVSGIKMECPRCGYKWIYKGLSKWFASCPRCRRGIRVPLVKNKEAK